MKTFVELVDEARKSIKEAFPWDIGDRISGKDTLVVDIREPYEFDAMRIQDSINVPRGILETACEYNYEETVPELVEARDKEIIVICRSGNRSIFAAEVMQKMGYKHVFSLRTGLRGWADNEQPLVDKNNNPVDLDAAEEYFSPQVRPDQLSPKRK